ATVAAQFYKTGPGTLLFVGAATFSLNPVLSPTGPTMECRGGFSYITSTAGTWGQQLKFTTNNQSVTFSSSAAQPVNMVIDSGITVTLNSGTSSFICTGGINGVDSTSTLVNIGTIDFRAAGGIMTTGKLYCDTVAN